MKLSQVLAKEAMTKQQGFRTFTEIYHAFGKPSSFVGMTRTYSPSEEGGEALPTERQNVQQSGERLLQLLGETFGDITDLEATKNAANMGATADVMLSGEVLLSKVPATTLLFLEGQLKKILDELKKLPVLDPAYEWELDASTGLHRTAEPIEKIRTQKRAKAIVLHPPTKEHPAQTQLVQEDVPVGKWAETMHSGAVTAVRRRELLVRCTALINAIAAARSQANQVDAPQQYVGKELMDWLLR
jgi:hypothetical protein